jgi:Tol biopolymer transport system component
LTLPANRLSLSCAISILILCGCSVDVSQGSSPTSESQINTLVATPASASPLSTLSSPTQKATRDNNPGTKTSLGWRNLNLGGKLVYIAGSVKDGNLLIGVQSLDLGTGKISTIFQAPSDGWIDAAAVSPNGKQMVISYSPPTADPHGGQETLYNMSSDGSQPPQLLFASPSINDRYFQPEWSPDGKYLYFVNYNYRTTTIYSIMRMAYPGGALEKVADNAYWPRPSNNGSSLVYVTPAFGLNTLFVSNLDGSGAHQIPLTGSYIPNIIDAPMFLADDRSILFSAPVVGQSFKPNWVDNLFVIPVASADGSIPSDWWSIPLDGGIPKRLTHLQSLGLFARFSPDKKLIASYSAEGIFIMNSDGNGVTQVTDNAGGIPGTVNWIP